MQSLIESQICSACKIYWIEENLSIVTKDDNDNQQWSVFGDYMCGKVKNLFLWFWFISENTDIAKGIRFEANFIKI